MFDKVIKHEHCRDTFYGHSTSERKKDFYEFEGC